MGATACRLANVSGSSIAFINRSATARGAHIYISVTNKIVLLRFVLEC